MSICPSPDAAEGLCRCTLLQGVFLLQSAINARGHICLPGSRGSSCHATMADSAGGRLPIAACKYSSQLSTRSAPMWQELQAVRARLREEEPSEYRCCRRGHARVRPEPPLTPNPPATAALATATIQDIIHCLNIIKAGNAAPLHTLAGLSPPAPRRHRRYLRHAGQTGRAQNASISV